AESHEALLARFIAVIRRFRARGVDVILVQLPAAPGMRRWTEQNTSFESDLNDLVRQCGVEYIDGDRLMGLAFVSDRRNFYDPFHLNVAGSTAFTAALGA